MLVVVCGCRQVFVFGGIVGFGQSPGFWFLEWYDIGYWLGVRDWIAGCELVEGCYGVGVLWIVMGGLLCC